MLEGLGIEEKDTLLVLNKIDALADRVQLDGLLARYPNAIPISARRQGLAPVGRQVSEALSRGFLDVDVETEAGNGRCCLPGRAWRSAVAAVSTKAGWWCIAAFTAPGPDSRCRDQHSPAARNGTARVKPALAATLRSKMLPDPLAS